LFCGGDGGVEVAFGTILLQEFWESLEETGSVVGVSYSDGSSKCFDKATTKADHGFCCVVNFYWVHGVCRRYKGKVSLRS